MMLIGFENEKKRERKA